MIFAFSCYEIRLNLFELVSILLSLTLGHLSGSNLYNEPSNFFYWLFVHVFMKKLEYNQMVFKPRKSFKNRQIWRVQIQGIGIWILNIN